MLPVASLPRITFYCTLTISSKCIMVHLEQCLDQIMALWEVLTVPCFPSSNSFSKASHQNMASSYPLLITNHWSVPRKDKRGCLILVSSTENKQGTILCWYMSYHITACCQITWSNVCWVAYICQAATMSCNLNSKATAPSTYSQLWVSKCSVSQ